MLQTPSLTELVKEIIAVNQAWKLACDMGECSTAIAHSLADLKNRLQVRLLRTYAPEKVYLQIDTSSDSAPTEQLYGLMLRQPIKNYWNAAHLPVRVAQQLMSPQELQKFIISEVV
jgi:hypothetical protein